MFVNIYFYTLQNSILNLLWKHEKGLLLIEARYTYIEAGEVSGDLNGIGDTHMSSNGIFPTLSIKPGVEVLLGSAAKKKQRYDR